MVQAKKNRAYDIGDKTEKQWSQQGYFNCIIPPQQGDHLSFLIIAEWFLQLCFGRCVCFGGTRSDQEEA